MSKSAVPKKPAKSAKKAKATGDAAAEAAAPPRLSFDTLCIQGGYDPKVSEPRVLPIVQSTTYKYDDIDHVNRI
ncbi:MAG: hypothetical protein LBF91_09850, partial [Azoarcus sp.]|nr:hypothetical protein [Azoarcus sp.]